MSEKLCFFIIIGLECGISGAWRSLASALDWGSRGRRFKSCRPDFVCDTGYRYYVLTGGFSGILLMVAMTVKY